VIDATFAALADPTRREVVERLRSEPQRAGALAAAMGMRAPLMSRHLKVLRDAGLVRAEGADDARVRIYRLEPAALAELRAWLDEVEGYWGGQLAAFKAHAEREP
jgi:DNA-binding transcriptional ArsR family regulator